MPVSVYQCTPGTRRTALLTGPGEPETRATAVRAGRLGRRRPVTSCVRIGGLDPAGGGRIGVAQVQLVQDSARQLRGEVVADIGQRAHRGVDPRRLLHQPAHHHRRRVLGADRRNRVEPPGRRDHRRRDQRHVDVGESDVVGQRLGGHHVGERVQRRLAGHVGAVLGTAGLHAGAGHVDDVAEPALTPMRQQRQHHPHRTEVVDRHHPFVVVQPVGGRRSPTGGSTGRRC